MTNVVLITGLNGTVAPVIAATLQQRGSDVVGWDRAVVSELDPAASLHHLDKLRPDEVWHIGMGPPEWAALMAGWCRNHDRPFVFTSTVSVFSGTSGIPYTVADQPDATDDYGRYKFACEQAIFAVNAAALVARLGWQIGDGPGSNNMIDFVEQAAVGGVVELSNNMLPGCSFLEDTAEALIDLRSRAESGIFHVDGNPGLSLYEIGNRLSRLHDNRWQVRPGDEPRSCSLMEDDRVTVAPITARLDGLAT